MDEANWDQLVARWEERDRRWEERDQRWEERDRRWEERDRRWEQWAQEMAEGFERREREQRAFMREMWTRMEEWDIRSRAAHEHLIGRMDALTEAVLRIVDRLDGEDGAATA